MTATTDSRQAGMTLNADTDQPQGSRGRHSSGCAAAQPAGTTRKPRRVLTPVTVTSRYPSFRSGRVENWSAVSADGVWKYERLEIGGTPWQVEHVPTGTTGDWYGSLPKARAATADGSALAFVERVLAHERGEHAAERDIRCGRC